MDCSTLLPGALRPRPLPALPPAPCQFKSNPKCHKPISSLQNQSEATVPENFHTPDPWSACKSQSFSAKLLPPTPPLPPTLHCSLGWDWQEHVASALSRLGLLEAGDPDITLLCKLCHSCNGICNLSWKGVNQTSLRTPRPCKSAGDALTAASSAAGSWLLPVRHTALEDPSRNRVSKNHKHPQTLREKKIHSMLRI